MDPYRLFVVLAVIAGAGVWCLEQQGQSLLSYLALMSAVVIPGQLFANLFAAAEHTGFTVIDVFLGSYGSNFIGGAIGGVIALWILLQLRPLTARFGSPLKVLDQAACFVPLSMAIGRVGCFISGDGCYGPPTGLPWGVAFPHGTVPTGVPVHPTMLYDAVLLFLFFLWIVWTYRGRFIALPPRIPLATFLIFYGCERFLCEFLRLNPKYAGLSQAQWLSLVAVVVGVIVVMRANKLQRQGLNQ